MKESIELETSSPDSTLNKKGDIQLKVLTQVTHMSEREIMLPIDDAPRKTQSTL